MAKRAMKTTKKAPDTISRVKREVKRGKNLTAMSIVNRLSRKYLRVDEDISFRDSPAIDRKSRQEIFSSSMATENENSIACYDFNEDDDNIRLRLDLSPINSEKTPSSIGRKSPKSANSKGKENKSRTKSTPNAAKLSKKKKTDWSEKKNSKTSTEKKRCKRQNNSSTNSKKRKVDLVGENNLKNKVTPTSKPRNKKSTNKIDKLKSFEAPQDSGVFMTPPSMCEVTNKDPVPQSITNDKPAAKKKHKPADSKLPTSTPSEIIKEKHDVKSQPWQDFPEFDIPDLSPVKKVITPHSGGQRSLGTSQSDLSMDYDAPEFTESFTEKSADPDESFTTLNISKTYSNLGFGYGFFDKPIEKKKRFTKKTVKRQSVSRYDVIADQINQEFDDLDDFQLSVD